MAMATQSQAEKVAGEVEFGRPVVRRARGALACRVAGTALVLPVYLLLLWFVVAHLMGDPRGSWRPGAWVLGPATFVVSLVIVRPLWGGMLAIAAGGFCLGYYHDSAAQVLLGVAPMVAGSLLVFSAWLERGRSERANT
jgi:hypothetical protein